MKRLIAFLFIIIYALSPLYAQSGSDEQLAEEYLTNGEVEKALTLYKDLYDKTPTPFIYRKYLDALLQQKEFNDAEKLIRKQQKKYPQDASIKVDLGYVTVSEGNKNKADKYFSSIIADLPAQDFDIRSLAQAFTQRYFFHYAIETYLQGRKILADPSAYAWELANLYQTEGKYKEMMTAYMQLLQQQETALSFVQSQLQVVLSKESTSDANEQIRKALMQQVQSQPTDKNAQELLIWWMMQEGNEEQAFMQAKTFDKRFKDNGKKVLDLAQIFVDHQSFALAEKAYQYLIDQGPEAPLYIYGRIGLLKSYYASIISAVSVDHKALVNLESSYQKMIADYPTNELTISLMRDLAHIYAFYDHQSDKAIQLLEEAIKNPKANRNMIAECKVDLGDILLFSGDVWDASLSYSQVEKDFRNDEIGFFSKLKNAQLFYYIGEFEWAESQLDVLKSATSKLIANDAMELYLLISENRDRDSGYVGLTYFAHADLLTTQKQFDQALIVLDSISQINEAEALFDDVLYKKAQIKIQQKKFNEADELLTQVYTHFADGLLADDALYLDAKLNEEILHNKVKAMSLYEKIWTDYPSSLYINDARKRFRSLRENLIN